MNTPRNALQRLPMESERKSLDERPADTATLSAKLQKQAAELVELRARCHALENRVQNQDGRLETERGILELISTGSPLNDILERLCLFIERQLPGARCFVSLLDRSANCLRFVAGPSIPPEYAAGVEGLVPSRYAGSSGTCVFLRKRVIVADVSTDPRYTELKDFARKQGIQACWSTPIFCKEGSLLGAFSISHRRPRSPTSYDLQTMRTAAHLAGISIERKKDEEALRESEGRLRQVLDLVPHFIFAKDREGRFILANKTLAKTFNLTVEEILGRTDAELASHPSDAEKFRADDLEVIASGRQKFIAEEQFTNSEGVVQILQTTKIPVTFGSSQERSVLGIAIDITQQKKAEEERRNLEAQMLHAQKLESLGLLAGGIAHDFNNLLGGILGNAGLIDMKLASDHPCRPWVREIERAADRAADLANQLLAYSGKGNVDIQTIHLNGVVEEMAQLLEVSTSKKAQLKLDLAHRELFLMGDVTQLRQVVMNLITNASDALMEKGGTIAITTGSMQIDRNYLAETYLAEDLPEGRYVFLQVQDDGCGMAAEARERIFDPFFTTKATGRGLGMASVLGIVRSHGGAIKVDSRPGLGSTFRVLFPAAKEINRKRSPQVQIIQKSWRGSGKVLVVDDEEIIRIVARATLEATGFDVLLAEDGQHALEVFQQDLDGIVAVLLDMKMPRLDGVETYRELRRLKPDVKVVFSSGYNEADAVPKTQNTIPPSFIKKPYGPDELIRKVRDILN